MPQVSKEEILNCINEVIDILGDISSVTPNELVRFVEKKMNYNKHDLDSYMELMDEMLNDAAISRAEESAIENVNNGTAMPLEAAPVNQSDNSVIPYDGNDEEINVDPEPATPLDAYGCFHRDTLDTYMEKYPDMPFMEVLNQQSSDWNSMSAEEKEKWELVSKKAKKQFIIDFQKWQERNPSRYPENRLLLFQSIVRTDGDPDFRRSAFIFYAVDHWLERVVENLDCSRYEIMKLLRKEWDLLSDKEKKPYKKREKEDNKRYLKEMKAAHPEMTEEEILKNNYQLKETSSNGKKLRRPGCFSFMLVHYHKQYKLTPKLSQEDINKKLYDDWMSLSEQEKSEYEKISDKKDSFNKDAVLAGVRSVAGCRHASKFYVQLMISEVKLLDEAINRNDRYAMLLYKWGTLTEAQREPYYAMQREDEKRFDREMRQVNPLITDRELIVLRTSKKKKNTGIMKVTHTARSYYVDAMKEEMAKAFPLLPPQGVIEVIRRKWAKMTPQEKAPYEAMEAAYQKSQMTEMKQVFPDIEGKERKKRSANTQNSSIKPPREKRLREVIATKRPPSFFYLRSQYELYHKSHPDISQAEVYANLYQQWSDLSEEERAPYERMSNEEDAFIKAIHGDKEQPIEEDKPTTKIVQKRKPSGIFMTMNLPLVRKEFPKMKSAQLREILAERYRNLSDEEKKKYKDLAHEDAKRYEREMKEAGITKKSLGITLRRSPFKFYSMCVTGTLRKAHPEYDRVSFEHALREQWNALTEQEKNPFIQMAQSDSERYRSELAQKRTDSSKHVKKTYSEELMKQTKGIVVAPRLPYMYFILMNTPAYKVTHRKVTRDQIRKDLSEEWKRLENEEKQLYLQMGEEDQLRFEKEMDAAERGELDRLMKKKKLREDLSCMDDGYYFFEREVLGRSIVDKKKEKKLFTTTRQKWEAAGENKRLRLSLVGLYKQDECNIEVENRFERGESLDDAESILSRVSDDCLLFSSFVHRELKKHSEIYQSLSFIAKYNLLREKWKNLDDEERKNYHPIKAKT